MKKIIFLILICFSFNTFSQKIYNEEVKYKVTPNLPVIDFLYTKTTNSVLSETSVADFVSQIGLSNYLQTLSFSNGGLTISSANTVDLDTRYYSESEIDNLLNGKLNLTGGVITGDLTANNFTGNGSQLTNVDAEKVTSYNIGSNSFTETMLDFDDNTMLSGIYRVSSTTLNNPIGNSGVMYHMNSGATGYVTQIYQAISTLDINRMFIRHWMANTSNWSSLTEVIHTGNLDNNNIARTNKSNTYLVNQIFDDEVQFNSNIIANEALDFTAPNDVVNIKGATKTFLSFDTQDDILTINEKLVANKSTNELTWNGQHILTDGGLLGVQTAKITLTSSQIINQTAVEIIAAPAANKWIKLLSSDYRFIPNTTAFNGDIEVVLQNYGIAELYKTGKIDNINSPTFLPMNKFDEIHVSESRIDVKTTGTAATVGDGSVVIYVSYIIQDY